MPKKGERKKEKGDGKMKRNILATVMSLLMLTVLVTSVAAFWTPPDGPSPPPAPKPMFGTAIEGLFTEPGETFDFEEPKWGKCENFTVEVWVLNVTDLFGYEFKLYWDLDYFELLDYDYKTFADEMWGANNWFAIAPNETAYTGPPYAKNYHQAISAKAPAEGFGDEGNHVVATFTFHFVKDICWCQGEESGAIYTHAEIMADSTGNLITPMGTHLVAWWKYIAVQPKIYLVPDEVENEAYIEEDGTESLTFNMSVMVANITKMKSLHFRLMWKQHYNGRFVNDKYYLPILNATGLEVNEAVFFEPNFTSTVSKGPIWVSGVGWCDYIDFTAEMNQTYTDPSITELIRGDFEALKITFTKLDPWAGKRQPEYFYNATSKEWYLETAETDIWFEKGYFDVMCPDLAYIYFGEYYEGFIAPYTFTGTTTVSTSWPDNPEVPNLLFTVEVTYDCATDELTFEAEWWNNTIYVAGDSAGMLFDADCDGWSDFEVCVGAGTWPNHKYQVFNFGVLSWQPLPSYIDVYYDWSTKGHFWMKVTLPRTVLTPEPCTECYKWGIEARDMDEIGSLPMTGGDPPNPGPIIGMWLIDWPFVNYTAGENFYHGLQPDGTMGWGGSSKLYQTKTPVCYVAIYEGAEYTLTPKPGDLDGDSDVDLTDLMIIASYYGHALQPGYGYPHADLIACYYNLNKDSTIDIIDVVIVAKHYAP